ncbi:acyl-CoA dehydrogenase family member 9, mitochondrial-like [Pocillopora damicornis]|uniref:acyl-CoA dehydrogenase family member 9, mitochondrial-like n=1 Tax=Pocillopora damicornis TaxID=46731 RepID=UPI000F551347|nr:acyl-CoA dehydrogenase family member 9, mitochondrial-like [Pocillopora damicornis]
MMSLRAGRHVLSAFKPVNVSSLRRFLHTSKPTSTFAKDLFLGRCNKEKVFPYPDPLNEEQRETLNMLVEPVEKYFVEKVDSAHIDKTAKIPEEVMGGLKELGLFGLLIPEEYGGLGLLNTNYARVCEAFSDASIAVTLMAHQSIGLKGILLLGTEEQKQKYLPRLASGEHMAAFCLTEPSSGSDAASIQTKATLSEDGKHFLLNGSKIWISNGGWADVMTVFARTTHTNDKHGSYVKSLGYMKEYPYERVMRDSRILLIFEGTNEILRMYIALAGMQHAGKHLQEVLKYLKNPFGNVEFMTDFLKKRALYALGLKGNLQGIANVSHPQLADSVKKLEENIADFGRISENLLSKFGKNIIEEQFLLKRMADVAINLYGMTAVISRATRSINRGSPSASHEALLVDTICKEKYHANNTLLKEVKSGTKSNGDEQLKKIAEEIFKSGGTVTPHALTV